MNAFTTTDQPTSPSMNPALRFQSELRDALEYAPKCPPSPHIRAFTGPHGVVCSHCVARLCARGCGTLLMGMVLIGPQDSVVLAACVCCGEIPPVSK